MSLPHKCCLHCVALWRLPFCDLFQIRAFHGNFSPRGETDYKLCGYFSLLQWNQDVILRVTNSPTNLTKLQKGSGSHKPVIWATVRQWKAQCPAARYPDYPYQIAVLPMAKSNPWTHSWPWCSACEITRFNQSCCLLSSFPQNNPILITVKCHA